MLRQVLRGMYVLWLASGPPTFLEQLISVSLCGSASGFGQFGLARTSWSPLDAKSLVYRNLHALVPTEILCAIILG